MDRPEPTQARSRERVSTIFEATKHLLREGGTERCTVAAIAARADISPASLYRYFPDATSILRALAERSLDEIHQGMALMLEGITCLDDVEPVLRAGLDIYIDQFTSDRAMRELWFGALADRELVALNVADSRRNGALLARALAPYSNVTESQLRDRWFLLSHMIGAAVGLISDLPTRESKRVRAQFHDLMKSVLPANV